MIAVLLDPLHGGAPVKRAYRTDETCRLLAKERRDLLRSRRLCINGAAHGEATHGCRCARCADTHRRSA